MRLVSGGSLVDYVFYKMGANNGKQYGSEGEYWHNHIPRFYA